METIKRFISAVLLACLLLAITVPAVSAEENTPVTYQFGFRNTSGAANKTLKTETNVALGGTQGAACQYISISNNTTGTRWERATFAPRFKGDDEENRAWVAIQINVATKGTYDMVFNVFNTDTYGQGAAKVYVLTQDGYNKATQPYQLKLASTSHNLTLSENESIYNALYNNNAVLNAGTETTISGNGADYKAFTDVGIGKVTFPEAGNYVLLFESKGAFAPNVNDTYAFYLVSLTMTPVVQAAAVASSVRNGVTTEYASADALAAAINGAVSDTTFTLLADELTTEIEIELPEGVILDLNGKTLTATVDATQGTVTDATDGAGAIVGSSVVKKTGANEIAIKTGNTYKIFNYTMTVEETAEEKDNGSVSFWFKVDLSDAALGLIDDGTTDFAVGAVMQWTPTEGASSSKPVALAETEVTKWAGLMQEEDYWFYLNVTGFDTLGDVTGTLTVTPTISGNAGTPINYSVK